MIEASTGKHRYFPRINYRAYGTLISPHNRWDVHILDLSFNGALVAILSDYEIDEHEELLLKIELENGDVIKMQGQLAHSKEHLLGIECRASGIDNQKHLHDLLDEHKQHEDEHKRELEHMLTDHAARH